MAGGDPIAAPASERPDRIPITIYYYRKKRFSFSRPKWYARTVHPESGETVFVTRRGYETLADLLGMIERHFPDTVTLDD